MDQSPLGNGLSRRELLRRGGLLATTLALAPACGIGAPAQPAPRRLPRVGVLLGGGREGVIGPGQQAFIDGLRDHGYVEGENVAIEWRYGEGRAEQLGVLLRVVEVRDRAEIERAIRDLADAGVEALLVIEDPLFQAAGGREAPRLASARSVP